MAKAEEKEEEEEKKGRTGYNSTSGSPEISISWWKRVLARASEILVSRDDYPTPEDDFTSILAKLRSRGGSLSANFRRSTKGYVGSANEGTSPTPSLCESNAF